MISSSMLRLLSVASLLWPASAAPTRTRCHCTIVNADSHYLAPESLSASRKSDICSNIGSDLQYIQNSRPDLYESYFQSIVADGPRSSSLDADDIGKPIRTALLMHASEKRLLDLDSQLPSTPTQRPMQKIICQEEPDALSAYPASETTLFILQAIVAFVVLVAVAECLGLLMDWLEQDETQRVRLAGSEKSLWAFPTPEQRSAMSEKDCVSTTSEENDDDDEMHRPVM